MDITIAFCKNRLNELFEFTDYFTLLNHIASFSKDCRTVRDFNLLLFTCDIKNTITLNNLTVYTGKNFLTLMLKDWVTTHKILSIFNKKLIISCNLNLVENADNCHITLTSKEPLILLFYVCTFDVFNKCIELKYNLVIISRHLSRTTRVEGTKCKLCTWLTD